MVMPHYADDWLTVYLGDCREVMAQMEPESVHCVVTSPPYWGLRDYGTHGQLGLEPTPEEYVANMVAVFREVRRVLRSDGTVWLNLGDSYASGEVGRVDGGRPETMVARGIGGSMIPSGSSAAIGDDQRPRRERRIKQQTGLKPKDLVGIPWRVAFALQADGWYLRSDIIWSKPNPMPESVTDRPTKAHEYLFLLSKSARYYYDGEAVRLPVSPNWSPDNAPNMTQHGNHVVKNGHRGHWTRPQYAEAKGANLRSVWTIATQPYPGAHFATFPPKLVEPCIKAGTSERGVCPECGAPWMRIVSTSPLRADRERNVGGRLDGFTRMPGGEAEWRARTESTTTGWRPSCGHASAPEPSDRVAPAVTVLEDVPTADYRVSAQAALSPIPATILDPFAGSGTTGMVAQSLSRRAVLIDLSADYLRQLMGRNRDIPLGIS